jgi:hypothetical protein
VSGSCIAGFCYCLHFTQIQQIAIKIPCFVLSDKNQAKRARIIKGWLCRQKFAPDFTFKIHLFLPNVLESYASNIYLHFFNLMIESLNPKIESLNQRPLKVYFYILSFMIWGEF